MEGRSKLALSRRQRKIRADPQIPKARAHQKDGGNSTAEHSSSFQFPSTLSIRVYIQIQGVRSAVLLPWEYCVAQSYPCDHPRSQRQWDCLWIFREKDSIEKQGVKRIRFRSDEFRQVSRWCKGSYSFLRRFCQSGRNLSQHSVEQVLSKTEDISMWP